MANLLYSSVTPNGSRSTSSWPSTFLVYTRTQPPRFAELTRSTLTSVILLLICWNLRYARTIIYPFKLLTVAFHESWSVTPPTFSALAEPR